MGEIVYLMYYLNFGREMIQNRQKKQGNPYATMFIPYSSPDDVWVWEEALKYVKSRAFIRKVLYHLLFYYRNKRNNSFKCFIKYWFCKLRYKVGI